MSVVPASRLSRQDLALLGNNVGHPRDRGRGRPRTAGDRARRLGRRELAAVNRSLSALGERTAALRQRATLS